MNRNILFRVDGFQKIGYGHFMRCFVLGKALQENNFSVKFITYKDKFIHSILKKNNIDHIETHFQAGTKRDLAKTSEILTRYHDSALVYDSYNISADYEKEIFYSCNKMIAFDDEANRSFYTDIIINQNYRSGKYKYKVYKKKTSLLCGSKYILLRDEFLKRRRKNINQEVKDILLIFGGSDVKDQSLRITNLLHDYISENKINLHIITNDNYKSLTQLRKLSQNNSNIILHHNLNNIAEVMQKMDLAISASGSTVWELLYMGVPSLLLVLADNQNNICVNLGKDNYAVNLGWYNRIKDKNILMILKKLVNDYRRRMSLFRRGQTLIDGKGKERIIKYFIKQLSV